MTAEGRRLFLIIPGRENSDEGIDSEKHSAKLSFAECFSGALDALGH